MCVPPMKGLKDLVTYTESRGVDLLIDSDPNVQHVRWESNICIPRREKLFHLITSADVLIIKVECVSTFVGLRIS